MIYPQNFETRIEFDAIRRMLKDACLCQLGRERVEDMQFMTDFTAVDTRLNEVVIKVIAVIISKLFQDFGDHLPTLAFL